MKIAFFSTHSFEKESFTTHNHSFGFEFTFFEAALNQKTALLTQGFECVCCFVSDQLNSKTLQTMKESGVSLVALRSAGYNNVDLEAADRLGIAIVRVPAYSPHAVAEHAVGLLLSLIRKIHKAYARVRELNFSLDGLIGFDLFGKTVGVIGTGRIGSAFSMIMKGFGCQVLAYDPFPDTFLIEKQTVTYVPLEEIFRNSDVISLHVPLMPETKHLINSNTMNQMKRGVILVNTGRGELIHSAALIQSLKSGQLGGACLDVYEEEEGIFFKDLSTQGLKDDILARLLTFPNVLMTSHQAFLTKEALDKIALTTLQNILEFKQNKNLSNQVHAKTHLASSTKNSNVGTR